MLIQMVSAYGADSIAGGGASLSWKFSWLKMLEDPRCDLGADELDSSLRRDIYRTKLYTKYKTGYLASLCENLNGISNNEDYSDTVKEKTFAMGTFLQIL